MLKNLYTTICSKYFNKTESIEILWNEIVLLYEVGGRFYHTMNHLEQMFIQLQPVESEIKDFEVLFFALIYHDIIYRASSTDNEIRSAELALKRLAEIRFPKERADLVYETILATTKHQKHLNTDINYFIDSDLSILGEENALYQRYANQIRQEYIIYPDADYKEGRKKVLNHFLQQEFIFKTEIFRLKFENQARLNLETELKSLE